jgi:transcriptional regulator with XRE-family HTH domain
MPSGRELFETLKSYIEEKGGYNVSLDLKRKHSRIYFNYRGVKRFLVTSQSPSDFRTTENAKSTINELFNYIRDITPNHVAREEEAEVIKAPSRELPQTFGERLQFAREQQQLSRERLADLSGIDEELIQRYEVTKQESLRDFRTALLLSSALNLSLSYLVGEQTAREFKPMTAIGDAISRERQRRSMSLIDLSAKAGLSVQQLANIETGLFNPALAKIDEIAKALQVKREELTKEVVVETRPPAAQPPSNQALYDGVNTLQDLAVFVRSIRERKGITQNDLAQALGMGYPAEVSRIERGLWAGGVYKRLAALAGVLSVPEDALQQIIKRVIRNAGPSPSMAYAATIQKRPKAKKIVPVPKEEKVEDVQPFPEDFPEVAPARAILAKGRDDVATEQLMNMIREQAEITRALLRSQHEELVNMLKALPAQTSPADMLHNAIDNLFRKST